MRYQLSPLRSVLLLTPPYHIGLIRNISRRVPTPVSRGLYPYFGKTYPRALLIANITNHLIFPPCGRRIQRPNIDHRIRNTEINNPNIAGTNRIDLAQKNFVAR